MSWTNLDLQALLSQRQQQHQEATVAANAGAFAVPMGGVLRPPAVSLPGVPAAALVVSAAPASPGWVSLDDVLAGYARAIRK
jgi:hypothetical protein